MEERKDVIYMRDPQGAEHRVNVRVKDEYIGKGWVVIPTPFLMQSTDGQRLSAPAEPLLSDKLQISEEPEESLEQPSSESMKPVSETKSPDISPSSMTGTSTSSRKPGRKKSSNGSKRSKGKKSTRSKG